MKRGTFIKICPENPNLLNYGQKISVTLHEDDILLPATQICHESIIMQHSIVLFVGSDNYQYYTLMDFYCSNGYANGPHMYADFFFFK